MKKKLPGTYLVLCTITLIMSCAIYDGSVNKSSMKKVAEAGYSEVVVVRGTDRQKGRVSVYIDGEQTSYLSEGNSSKQIVPDGKHTIFVDWENKEGNLSSNSITFTSIAVRYIFRVHFGPNGLQLGDDGSTALSNRAAGGIDMAITRCYEKLAGDIPVTQDVGEDETEAKKTIISIINIASSDSSRGEYVVGKLTDLFIDSKTFDVVDRSSLSALEREELYQNSGDVDDKSIIGIGNKLGASVVITGSIIQDGPNSVLRIKALDVKTAKIFSSCNESF
ncbi:CsgG/HfaB family protein [Breznakiellaceae bacterium SP9]